MHGQSCGHRFLQLMGKAGATPVREYRPLLSETFVALPISTTSMQFPGRGRCSSSCMWESKRRIKQVERDDSQRKHWHTREALALQSSLCSDCRRVILALQSSLCSYCKRVMCVLLHSFIVRASKTDTQGMVHAAYTNARLDDLWHSFQACLGCLSLSLL